MNRTYPWLMGVATVVWLVVIFKYGWRLFLWTVENLAELFNYLDK